MWMLHSGEFSWGWRAPTSVLSNGSLTTGYGGFRSYHNKDEKINILEGCKVTNLLWGQPAIHQGHNLHHLQPKCPSFINREKKETSALNLSKWRILRILECGYPKLWVSTPKWPNDLEHLGYSHFRTPELQKNLEHPWTTKVPGDHWPTLSSACGCGPHQVSLEMLVPPVIHFDKSSMK